MSQDLDQQVRKAVTDFCRQAPGRYPVFSIVIVGLILVLIIWYIPLWQVPAAGLSLKDRLHQINENRKTVAQIVGGVFILVGLYIAWVRSKAMKDQAEVGREQQLTDLYVKAIEQLGNKEILEVRLGGIYALERIARESPKDHWPIMEVLTAFVRENAPQRKAMLTAQEAASPSPYPPSPSSDIQAVLTVIGRRTHTYGHGEEQRLDLRDTHLGGADLQQGNFQGARFAGADLQETYLENSILQGADLTEANLRGAGLWDSNLQDACLFIAKLQETRLVGANLKGANLRGSKGLTPLQIVDAIWDETTQWPEGFSPPPQHKKEEEE